MDNNTIISVLISVLTISSTLFVVISQRKTEKLKIIENQLSQSKYKAYVDLVQVFYDTLKDVKQNKESDSNSLGSKIYDAKKDIFMFGSDEVFQKFNSWHCNMRTSETLAPMRTNVHDFIKTETCST